MAEVAVVAAGGSLLYDGSEVNHGWLAELVACIGEFTSDGNTLGLVIGGGYLARQGISTARESGILDVHELDLIGIAATRVNAAGVRDALTASGVGAADEIPETIEEAAALFSHNSVVVMGGTIPGHTTDAVSIGLAIAANAPSCTIATNVDFIYDSNPRTNPDAKPIPRLSLAELQAIVGPPSHAGAGPNVVIDPIGVQLAIDNNLALSLLNGGDVANLAACLAGDSFKGSVVEVS
jgi:uridylate kinase